MINEFELKAVDEDLIYEELASLNIHKAVGLDDIAPRFLRNGAKKLAPLIIHIVNLSIESAVVPQDLKFAKIIPLYKKNSHLEVGNYRPISLLSSVS